MPAVEAEIVLVSVDPGANNLIDWLVIGWRDHWPQSLLPFMMILFLHSGGDLAVGPFEWLFWILHPAHVIGHPWPSIILSLVRSPRTLRKERSWKQLIQILADLVAEDTVDIVRCVQVELPSTRLSLKALS